MRKLLTLSLIGLSLLFLNGCSIGKYDGLTAEEWSDEANACEDKLDAYRTALEEANNNIEDAQSWAGDSYEDMEDILLNLETVPEPY